MVMYSKKVHLDIWGYQHSFSLIFSSFYYYRIKNYLFKIDKNITISRKMNNITGCVITYSILAVYMYLLRYIIAYVAYTNIFFIGVLFLGSCSFPEAPSRRTQLLIYATWLTVFSFAFFPVKFDQI